MESKTKSIEIASVPTEEISVPRSIEIVGDVLYKPSFMTKPGTVVKESEFGVTSSTVSSNSSLSNVAKPTIVDVSIKLFPYGNDLIYEFLKSIRTDETLKIRIEKIHIDVAKK